MADIPVVKAVPYNGDAVQVVAPMNLQEGYQLQVDVNGETQSIRVPAGGVKEGQTFQGQPLATGGVVHNIPSGKWRDGLCDCFKFGCCHAMCWLGWCFEPILTGQIMTRMSRDIFGGPGPRPSVSSTCRTVTTIFVVVVVMQAILQVIMDVQTCYGARSEYNPDTDENELVCPDGEVIEGNSTYYISRGISGIIGFVFAVYMLLAICRTREAIRNKYSIPPGSCGGCEDFCCAFWCSCCTVQQMARHTNDYEQYDVNCCSSECCNKRGQQEQVPEI